MIDVDRSARVLEDCVASVRMGRKTVADCLRDHPEEQETLARLLPLGSALTLVEVSLDPTRKIEGRVALAEAIHREEPQPLWAWPRRVLRRAPLAVGMAVLVVALTLGLATSAAASEAQPGDFLYRVKTGLEEVRVVVAASPEAKAKVHLEIAGTRLAEVERALSSGHVRAAEVAAAAYASTITLVTQSISAPGARSFTKKVREILDATAEREAMVLASASSAGSDATHLTLQRARDQVERVLEELDSRVDPVAPATPTSRERSSAPPSPAPQSAVAGALSPSQTPRASQDLSGRGTPTPRPAAAGAAPVPSTGENRTVTATTIATATVETRPIRGFVQAPTAEARDAPSPTSVRPVLPTQARARADDDGLEEGPRLLFSPTPRRETAAPVVTAAVQSDVTANPAVTADRSAPSPSRTPVASATPVLATATATAEPSSTPTVTLTATHTATATRPPTATSTPTRTPTATATTTQTPTATATTERRGRGADRSGAPGEEPAGGSTPGAAPTEILMTAGPTTPTPSAPTTLTPSAAPNPGRSDRGDRQDLRDRNPRE